jgi:hypothetical protein
LAFATSGTQRLVIGSNGRIGIGTSSPGARLAVVENAAGTGIQLLSSDANGAGFIGTTNESGTQNGVEINCNRGNGKIVLKTNNQERLRIDSSGRVGLGTSSPAHNLDISPSSGAAELKISGAEGQEASIRLFADQGDDAADIKRLLTDTSGNFKIQHYSGSAYVDSMVINSSGNVGIGTTSPQTITHVFGADPILRIQDSSTSIADGFAAIQLAESGAGGSLNNYWQIALEGDSGTSTDHLTFKDGTGERMRIDSSGKVGIGTTSPSAALHIENSGADAAKLRVGFDSTRYYDIFRKSSDGLGFLNFYGSQTGFTGYVFGGVDGERLRIDSSGRLLVGTSSARSNIFGITPYFQLEGANSNSNRFASLTYGQNDPAGGAFSFNKHRGTAVGSNTIVQSGDTLGGINFTGADGTNFVIGASVKAEVDGTPGSNDMPGRLTFNTTADGASSPTERMRITNQGIVQTRSETTALQVATTASANSSSTLISATHSATTVGTGTECFLVRFNGDTKNTNNAFGAISDAKLKENIVDASSQWDDIKAVQVRNYNFKESTGYQTHTQLGVVAQEIETVSPGLVAESPDFDNDGNDLGTVTKSVNYSVLYMKAVKALQEAMDRIETLEAKVAALEAQ